MVQIDHVILREVFFLFFFQGILHEALNKTL